MATSKCNYNSGPQAVISDSFFSASILFSFASCSGVFGHDATASCRTVAAAVSGDVVSFGVVELGIGWGIEGARSFTSVGHGR